MSRGLTRHRTRRRETGLPGGRRVSNQSIKIIHVQAVINPHSYVDSTGGQKETTLGRVAGGVSGFDKADRTVVAGPRSRVRLYRARSWGEDAAAWKTAVQRNGRTGWVRYGRRRYERLRERRKR